MPVMMRETYCTPVMMRDLLYASYVWEETEKQTKQSHDEEFHKGFTPQQVFALLIYYLSKVLKARLVSFGSCHHLGS